MTGIHNCCGACNKAVIKSAVKEDGLAFHGRGGLGPNRETFRVTGDYEATDLIRALHEAGFHVGVQK